MNHKNIPSGEVTKPQTLALSESPLSLADALVASGLNVNTSEASKVFVIRQSDGNLPPRIIRADMSSPSSFLVTSQFYLKSKDIVYVDPNNISSWNRVISQFFPFSTFLQSVDNLTNSD